MTFYSPQGMSLGRQDKNANWPVRQKKERTQRAQKNWRENTQREEERSAPTRKERRGKNREREFFGRPPRRTQDGPGCRPPHNLCASCRDDRAHSRRAPTWRLLPRARCAHRCFRVHTVDEIWRGRRVHHWLRLSPEIVCKAGRLDILTFLNEHRRLPVRVYGALGLAIKHGHCSIMQFLGARHRRLANEQDRSSVDGHYALIDPRDAMGVAIARDDVDMLRVLCTWWSPFFCTRDAIFAALKAGRPAMACSLACEADNSTGFHVTLMLYNQTRLVTRDKHDETRWMDQLRVLVARVPTDTLALALLSLATAGAGLDLNHGLLLPETSAVGRSERYATAIRLIAASAPCGVIDAALALAADAGAHEAGQFLVKAIGTTLHPTHQQ
nr:ankyrin repeat protein [Pandoravirus massiliensis]